MTVYIDESKLGQIDLIFIDAGVKISGTYYHEVILTQRIIYTVSLTQRLLLCHA